MENKTKMITVHIRNKVYDISPIFNRKSNGTVVFEKPEPELLLDILSTQIKRLKTEKFDLKIGAAFLHPKDTLNKKEGRRIATSRLKDVKFTIKSLMMKLDEKYLILNLQGEDNDLKVKYYIDVKIYADSRRLRVIGVHMRHWGDE